MTGQLIARIEAHLDIRDRAVLADLERFRVLDTRQIQRLHFADHATGLAAARACNRTLLRLRAYQLIAPLDRRIGGVRRGSASYIWQLAATGERFLRHTRGQAHRRRFTEPSPYFVNHTLAVADIAIAIIETEHQVASFTVEAIGTEPSNWRSYLGKGGEPRWLKPDLHVITSTTAGEGADSAGYEEHAFLEIDLGTEHLPRIQAKCQMYAAYATTGAYQAEHGLFPLVVWLSADPARRRALRAAIAGTRGLPQELFTVASPDQYPKDLGAEN